MNRYNRNKLIKFDILYKVVAVAAAYPVLLIIMQLSLRLAGVKYLANEYILKFIMKPTTILALFIIILMALLIIHAEQQFIFAGYERLFKERMRIAYVIDNGFDSMKNAVRLRNIPSVFLTGVIVFTMNLAIIYNIIINVVNVKTYISESVKKNVDVRYFIAGILAVMFFITVVGIFTSCIMYDKKTSFFCAFRESFRLSIKNMGEITFFLILYNITILGIVILLYAVISVIVIAGVRVLDIDKLGAAIYLTVIRYFSTFMNAVLSLVSIPAAFIFISWLYKKYSGEMKGERIYSEKHYQWMVKFVIAASCLLDIFYVYSSMNNNYFKQIDLFRIAAITSHRGSSILQPENTMAAFEQAVEDFTDYIELDVRQTRDGKYVVMHDENLKRTTGVDAKVGELTQEEICSLNAGYDIEGEFPGVTVPAFEEVLEFVQGKLVRLNIELKTAATDKDYARGIYDLLYEYDLLDSCVITSTDYGVLKEMKQLDEDIETGFILSMAVGNYYDMEYVDFFSVNYRFVTSTMIDVLHSRGKEIHIWTLNNEDDILKYSNMGADNIITDNPILAREVIYSKDAPDIFVTVLDYVFGN